MLFSIVILNYNTFQETLSCINSFVKIKNQDNIVLKFVIVDNNSPDGSGSLLKTHYEYDESVNVLLCKENLGFSKGNNVGYKYSLKYNPDFIILSNSDIEVKQKDFFNIIISLFEKKNFSVLGPDVYNPVKKIHQSPIFLDIPLDTKFVQRRILKLYKRRLSLLCRSFFNIKPSFQMNKRTFNTNDSYKKESCNGYLQGSFLIFSRNFMEAFPEGLYDGTFMYGEELILYYLLKEKEMLELYSPDIQVIHYEGVATKKSQGDYYKSSLWTNREMIKASYEILKVVKDK